MKPQAFLLYGMTVESAKSLREAFAQKTTFPRVHGINANSVKLAEAKQSVWMDLSGHAYSPIEKMRGWLMEQGYRTFIYVQEAPLPRTITESWVKRQATYGLIRKLPGVFTVEHARYAVLHALREAEGEAGAPKQPTEVDRLKDRQKQELLMTKTRQTNDMLQAKQRELSKKSREDAQKIANSAKPKAEG